MSKSDYSRKDSESHDAQCDPLSVIYLDEMKEIEDTLENTMGGEDSNESIYKKTVANRFKIWTEDAVSLLLEYRTKIKDPSQLHEVQLWMKVALQMKKAGFSFNAKDCKTQFNRMAKKYKKYLAELAKYGETPTWKFFNMFGAIFQLEDPDISIIPTSKSKSLKSLETTNGEKSETWKSSEVEIFLNVIDEFIFKYGLSLLDSQIWRLVSRKLNQNNINVSFFDCIEKWRALKNLYNYLLNTESSQNIKWKWFNQVNRIIKKSTSEPKYEVENFNETKTKFNSTSSNNKGDIKNALLSQLKVIKNETMKEIDFWKEKKLLLSKNLELEKQKMLALNTIAEKLEEIAEKVGEELLFS